MFCVGGAARTRQGRRLWTAAVRSLLGLETAQHASGSGLFLGAATRCLAIDAAACRRLVSAAPKKKNIGGVGGAQHKREKDHSLKEKRTQSPQAMPPHIESPLFVAAGALL